MKALTAQNILDLGVGGLLDWNPAYVLARRRKKGRWFDRPTPVPGPLEIIKCEPRPNGVDLAYTNEALKAQGHASAQWTLRVDGSAPGDTYGSMPVFAKWDQGAPLDSSVDPYYVCPKCQGLCEDAPRGAVRCTQCDLMRGGF